MSESEKTAIFTEFKNKLFFTSVAQREEPQGSRKLKEIHSGTAPQVASHNRLKPHHKRNQERVSTAHPSQSTSNHNTRYDSSPTKEPEPLCIFPCCGRGSFLIMWMDPGVEYRTAASLQQQRLSSSAPSDKQPQSQNNNLHPGNNNNSNSLVSSLSHHLLLDFGGSSSQHDQGASTPEQPPPPPTPTNAKDHLGCLLFSLKYDFQSSTLTLRIVRAINLAAKDFSGTSDPYVKVMLLPDKKNKLTTNIKRRNLNPRWNEVFAFEGYPYNKLTGRTLYMQVLDYDRFSRDDPIGEVCLPIGDLDLSKELSMWVTLQPCKSHMGKLGELLLTLCYQPTAETVTVGVLEARGLKAKDLNGLSDPYVKIWLMRDGKKVEKRKTVIKEKCLNPVYNETFMFCIPYEFIRQSSLVVSVMDYDRMGRNDPIGQITLSSKSGPVEVKHWNEMFQKSRQQVSQWHILKDFG